MSLSFALAQNTCDGCMGDTLISQIELISEKMPCWFNDQHHYFITLKDDVMFALHKAFHKLVERTNESIPEKCKCEIPTESCATIANKDEHAKCYMEASKILAYTYHEQETCSNKIWCPKEAIVTNRMMTACITGWDAIHRTC